MTLHVLASGSSGNCYLLQAADETLVLEAGIRFPDIKKALGFSLARVVGVLVTHRHGDHAKSVGDFLNSGIPVYAPADVLSTFSSHFANIVELLKAYRIGHFRILPLTAIHDVPCLSYVIEHPEMGRLLFMTDSVSFDYTIRDLDHILIEANYDDAILDSNIIRGLEPASMRERLLQSHCELTNAIRIVKAQQSTGTIKNLVLVHLSSRNSDATTFKARTECATGIPTTIAEPNITIELFK